MIFKLQTHVTCKLSNYTNFYPFLRKTLPFLDSIVFLAIAILKPEPLGLSVNDDVVFLGREDLQTLAVFSVL